MRKIGGLDIGTTGCKLTIFDEDGKKLDQSYRDYPVSRTAGAHEIDAESILSAVWEVIRDMAVYPDLAGIGVTSFGETFVLTDENGKPLHRAMLYTDPRGAEQCRALLEKKDGKEIAAITGLRPHEMYSLPKLMWIKENEPAVYKEARHCFLMEDFVVFALTGTAQIDYSLATRSMAFDIRNLNWSQEMFDLADVDLSLMSKPVPTGTSAGHVKKSAAAETGLSEQTQIVSVSHDQIAAGVGAGVFDSDRAVDGAGTVQCLTVVYDDIPAPEAMVEGSYPVVPYVVPGKYVSYGFSYTGGALMQWCVDTLAKKEKEEALREGCSVNELLERSFADRMDTPSGLLVLPHFAGAATPYMDTGSKGAVLGLTTDSSVGDIYRACMEGVVYEMRLNCDLLKKSGVHFNMLHATGGGAKSRVWMQMKADILNVPITALDTVDAGTVGSAMLTGTAVGCFADLTDAAAHMVKTKEVYFPREEMHEKYESVYQKYRKLYDAVRPLMDG